MVNLDPQLIKELEEKLKQEEKRLKKELNKFSVKKKQGKGWQAKFPNFGDDADENASEVDSFSRNVAMEETLAKELQDTLNSLKRIEQGTYGICKFCKQTIEVERLKIRPTSASCVICKQKLQDNPDKSIDPHKVLFGKTSDKK